MLTWKTRNIRNVCYKVGNRSHQALDTSFFGWNANRKNVSKELTVCKM